MVAFQASAWIMSGERESGSLFVIFPGEVGMTDERPADESSEPQASSDIDSPMPFLELPSE